MWLSSKRYDEIWDKTYELQRDKDELIRVVSGLVMSQGGSVTIPIPSRISFRLQWDDCKDGTMKIKSEVTNLKNVEYTSPKDG